MHHVWVDVVITRRKRFHLIQNPAGEVIFRSAYISDIWDWLTDEGHSQFRVSSIERTWTFSIVEEDEHKVPQSWPK